MVQCEVCYKHTPCIELRPCDRLLCNNCHKENRERLAKENSGLQPVNGLINNDQIIRQIPSAPPLDDDTETCTSAVSSRSELSDKASDKASSPKTSKKTGRKSKNKKDTTTCKVTSQPCRHPVEDMVQCHVCQLWIHPTCINEVNEEIIGIWACPKCRSISSRIDSLLDIITSQSNMIKVLSTKVEQIASCVNIKQTDLCLLSSNVEKLFIKVNRIEQSENELSTKLDLLINNSPTSCTDHEANIMAISNTNDDPGDISDGYDSEYFIPQHLQYKDMNKPDEKNDTDSNGYDSDYFKPQRPIRRQKKRKIKKEESTSDNDKHEKTSLQSERAQAAQNNDQQLGAAFWATARKKARWDTHSNKKTNNTHRNNEKMTSSYSHPRNHHNSGRHRHYEQHEPHDEELTQRTGNLRCYYCYERNHTVKTCRFSEPIQCFTCGSNGHKAKHHDHY